MNKGNGTIVIMGVLVVFVIGGLLLFFGERDGVVTMNSGYVEKFESALTKEAIARVGQPIEGFDASLLKQAFPTLVDADFAYVATAGGVYMFENEKLRYERKQSEPVTSGEQMITSAGYAKLLENVAQRFAFVVTDASIDTVIEAVLGTPKAPIPATPPVIGGEESIIYGTSAPAEGTAAWQSDCTERGGTFNTCGRSCPPGTEICAAVCGFTCDFMPAITDE